MNNMNGYEVMYVLDPKYDEEGLEEKKERLKTVIENQGGDVQTVDEWGKKRLAYVIDGFSEAVYLRYEFTCSSQNVDQISERSNVEEAVLRYQIFNNEEVLEKTKTT